MHYYLLFVHFTIEETRYSKEKLTSVPTSEVDHKLGTRPDFSTLMS